MEVGKKLLLSAFIGATLTASVTAEAYPVAPEKVPVDIIQDASLLSNFTLAYDDANKNIVYYAPKGGRTATMNGQPLIGYAILANGEGYLNAQMEYGVFGADKAKLFAAIQAAGKTPVQWPFRKTKVTPMTPGINPETGTEFCTETPDPVSGEVIKECSGSIFREIVWSRNGPSLGENIGVTALLTQNGSLVFETLLRQGNALQMGVEGEYLTAGTAFTATVRVKYDKLFENFHAYAGVNGVVYSAQAEAFWQREGLCLGRNPDDCGIWVEYTDSRGNVITTPTIDPDNKEQQTEVFQAIQRFVDKVRDEMLTPVTSSLDSMDTGKPNYGWKLNAQYERKMKGANYTVQFTSPIGVNAATTSFPVSIGCIHLTAEKDIERNTGGNCKEYWGIQ